MDVNLRQGTIEQIPEIVKLNKKIFLGMYENEPYNLSQYLERLEGKNPVVFVALNGGQIIANSISYPKEDSFYVWILGVSAEWRGKGIGNKLIHMNEGHAKKTGFKKISTKVYNVSPAMQTLLLKRGYKVERIDQSDRDSKYDAKHFCLEL